MQRHLNQLYLKEQFQMLRMSGGTKNLDHLSILNNIGSELDVIVMNVKDNDKALRLSLPSSYEHMKPNMIYRKKTLKYANVTSKLLSEEKRLESSNYTSSSEGRILICKNGKTRYAKRNCSSGENSSKSFDTTNNVFFVIDDDDFL